LLAPSRSQQPCCSAAMLHCTPAPGHCGVASPPRTARIHTRAPVSHQSHHSLRKPSSRATAYSYSYQDPHTLPLHTQLPAPFSEAAPPPYRPQARATRRFPCSIFCPTQFAGYVATRFLAADYLYVHRPGVTTACRIRHSYITHAALRFAPPRSPCLPQPAH